MAVARNCCVSTTGSGEGSAFNVLYSLTLYGGWRLFFFKAFSHCPHQTLRSFFQKWYLDLLHAYHVSLWEIS